MSTPPRLSPEDQKAVTAIQDACAVLDLVIRQAATQTSVPALTLARIVDENLPQARASRRLEELAAVIAERSIRRTIAAKLTIEERAFVGLKGDGVDNVPEPKGEEVAAAALQGGGKP